MTDFKQILNQIKQFVKKYYFNELFKGLILFVLFAFLSLLITALIEYFLWLPTGTRRFLYYTQWFVLALFFILFLARPILNLLGLRKDLSDEKAAVIIGQFFPDIKDKLLNALQLYRSDISSELLLAGVMQKANEIRHFKFSRAISFKQNFKYLPLLLIPLITVLVLRLTHYDKVIEQSYQRVMSYHENFEPPLPYSFDLLDSLQVVSGQDYNLRVKVSGDALPDNLFLNIDGKSLIFNKQNDSVFKFHFPVVLDNVEFSLSDGNHRLGNYKLTVIMPPVIQIARLRLIYPVYLHKKPVVYQQLTNFTVPQSTKIVWELQTAHTDTIRFGFNNNYKSYQVADKTFTLDTIAQSDFSYQIKPVNKFVTNYEQVDYNVHVIKDQRPEINVIEKKDTINRQNYYRINASDDYTVSRLQLVYTNQNTNRTEHVNIPVQNSGLVQATYVFPGNLKLQEGVAYAYYFQVFDNDSYHGYKSAKSGMFYYNKLTKKQLENQNLNQQAQNIQDFNKLKQKMSKQKEVLNKLSDKIISQKQTDWQTKKMLDNAIQQSEQQEEFFKQTIKKFQDLLHKLPEDKQDEAKKELEKRLQELAKMKKKQKLLDELKKIAEKLKKEDLLKKLKDLENYSEHQEKSLERMLELTKIYYMQQKMQKMSEALNKLAQKQDSLSRTSADQKHNQDALNKQLDSLQKQSDSLQQMNKTLKKPMELPDTKTDMQDIKQDMQKASDQLQNNQSQHANQSQSKAAQKMKKLSKDMQMAMMGGGGDQNEEDVKTLQAILKSLLIFSFKEEQMLTDLYAGQSKKHLSQQLLGQNRLKVYFKHINDSLYTLALRNPKISQMVLDEAYEIQNNLDKSLSYLSENQTYNTQLSAQYILKSANKLADFLSNALDQMKNASPAIGQGQGKKGKGKSFSLPDIIKKQNQALSKAKQGLSQKQNKGQKMADKGQDKNAKNKGQKNSQATENQAKRQYELYKMQQQVKEDLNQLGDKFSDQATKKKIQQLNKEMSDLQKRILKEGITQSVVNKMIALQHELLKLKKATFNQHEDNKRQSRTNFKQYDGIDSLFLPENIKFLPQNESLKRLQIPVNQDIKQKIMQYLN